MDPKLTLLFTLIGTIISLSHLGDENLAKIKLRWRNIALALSLMNTTKPEVGPVALEEEPMRYIAVIGMAGIVCLSVIATSARAEIEYPRRAQYSGEPNGGGRNCGFFD